MTSGPRTQGELLGAAGADREQRRDRHDEQESQQPEPRLAGNSGRRRAGRSGAEIGGRSGERLGRAHPAAGGSITSSGAIGSSRIRRPVAWNTAFAIAAAVADLPDLADTLGAERADQLVLHLDELDGHVRRVGVDGHEVLGQVARGPAPVTRVHVVALEQGLPHAPEHPAHQLAAGEQRVENATGRERPDEPPATRTRPSSGSTATSANWAPNVSSPCGVSGGGGRQEPIASASAMWLRASSSP